MAESASRLGLSGRLARAFQASQLQPACAGVTCALAMRCATNGTAAWASARRAGGEQDACVVHPTIDARANQQQDRADNGHEGRGMAQFERQASGHSMAVHRAAAAETSPAAPASVSSQARGQQRQRQHADVHGCLTQIRNITEA